MDIRAATPDDSEAIAAVMDEWLGRPIRSILQRMFLDHFHRTSLVATDDDGLAGGFAVSEPRADDDGPEQDRVVFRIDLRG